MALLYGQSFMALHTDPLCGTPEETGEGKLILHAATLIIPANGTMMPSR